MIDHRKYNVTAMISYLFNLYVMLVTQIVSTCKLVIFLFTSLHSLIHSFIHSFIHLSIRPFVHSSIRSFVHSSIRSFVHSSIRPFVHSSIRPFVHSFIRSFVYSSIRWLAGYSFNVFIHLVANCSFCQFSFIYLSVCQSFVL